MEQNCIQERALPDLCTEPSSGLMMSGLLSETGIMVALKLLKLMFVSRDEITNTQLDLPLI